MITKNWMLPRRTFLRGMGVTLGLPILRVSVDHGTAFDIAWKGIARHENMNTTIQYAGRLAAAKDA